MKAICLPILIAVCGLALTSCNTMSKEDCEQIDWNRVGFRAALRGQTISDAIPDRTQSCRDDYGLRPNFDDIQSGYAQGLRYFCTEDGGLTFGRNGGLYSGTCPKDTEKSFIEGYRTGKLDYVGNRVESLEDEIQRLRNDVSDRDYRIRSLESQLRRQ